jgi:hypothetical protein
MKQINFPRLDNLRKTRRFQAAKKVAEALYNSFKDKPPKNSFKDAEPSSEAACAFFDVCAVDEKFAGIPVAKILNCIQAYLDGLPSVDAREKIVERINCRMGFNTRVDLLLVDILEIVNSTCEKSWCCCY